jgi:DnaJ-class molecular chaperone
MENFYNLFKISKNASNQDIILSYQNSVKKFNNINKLSIEDINEIKTLKTGLYILLNKELRENYNNILEQVVNNNSITKNINNNIESLGNYENENNNFNDVFNIDNSWMNNSFMNNIEQNKNLRKKSDINIIGDRIFSLSELNKQPDLTDINVILRTPQQGRIDKNIQEI